LVRANTLHAKPEQIKSHIADLAASYEKPAEVMQWYYSDNRRMALVKVSLAGGLTALGGVVGFFLVAQLEAYLPYFLAIASSSFLYVALADLIPQLQKKLSARETLAQIVWLAVGMGMVTLVSGLAHSH
jgi:zinc and cadmium transporter